MADTKALRKVTQTRQAMASADQAYVEALGAALESNSSDEVAKAAGVSRQAMYKTLRKAFGPRKDSPIV